MCGVQKRFDEAFDFDRYNQTDYGTKRELLDKFEPELKEAFRDKRRQINSA
jgi:hypothetical protein